jgi:hypothetical protein
VRSYPCAARLLPKRSARRGSAFRAARADPSLRALIDRGSPAIRSIALPQIFE